MDNYLRNPYNLLLDNRIIYLTGNIDTNSADYVISNLLIMNSLDKKSDIKLYISSYGGSVYAGLAIYDCMQMIEAPVCFFYGSLDTCSWIER